MKHVHFFPLLLCLLTTNSAFAIDAVYEGDNGIRATVFESNCLACHSSELSGSSRNGAPSNVNFDSYDSAQDKGDRAIARAVNQMSMPPVFSGIPSLTQEQKDAMLAWQEAGFPQFADTEINATFDFSTLILDLPVVIVGNDKFSVTLNLFELPGSAFGFGFALQGAEPTSADSDKAATFAFDTGIVDIPEVELLNSGLANNKVSLQIQLIPGSSLQFDLITLQFMD